MEVSQGIIAGSFLMRKGSFPGRPSAGEALRPSDSTARGGYDAGNQVSQLRESFSGGCGWVCANITTGTRQGISERTGTACARD